MRAWFEALGYELIPGGIRQEDCFDLIIHVPKRGRAVSFHKVQEFVNIVRGKS